MTKLKEEKSQKFYSHRFEQLIWQAENSTPGERLALAEEMLEFMYAAGQDYHKQRALLDPDYWKIRGKSE